MICFPNVKINLGLFVTGKRPDGYHNIESIFVPVPWKEVVEVVPARTAPPEGEAVNLITHGIDIPGNASDNIILKTARELAAIRKLPALDIHLLKKLPMGAGLGGGSADAAFALRAMCSVSSIELSDTEATDLLSKVGSDCPFFWFNDTRFVHGRGEHMEAHDLDLSGLHILLVNPGIHISTKEAYAGVSIVPDPPIDLRTLSRKNIENWKQTVSNGFEAGVFNRYPEIKGMKESLYEMGAVYASMTGSGSTVYGIFEAEPDVPNSWSALQHWCGALH